MALLCPLLCHVPICRSRSFEPSLTLLATPSLSRRWALRILLGQDITWTHGRQPMLCHSQLEATDWIFSVEAIGPVGFGAWACWVTHFQAMLDLLRPLDGWSPNDEPTNYGIICEEDESFWQMVSDGSSTVRKTTNRQGNKLQTLCNILVSKDLSRTRKLQGRQRPHFTQAFPAAKPWVKQLFAGQMGLTVMHDHSVV